MITLREFTLLLLLALVGCTPSEESLVLARIGSAAGW